MRQCKAVCTANGLDPRLCALPHGCAHEMLEQFLTESGSSDEEFNPYLSDSGRYNHSHPKGNILFDDLADEFNGIVFGLNDSNDKYSPDLRLRKTYINMMKDPRSKLSLLRLQCAAAHLLSQLLDECLFIHMHDGCDTLWGLMVSMLSYLPIEDGLHSIATGENKFFPLPPGCALAWPTSTHQSGANPLQPPPHVSGTAGETTSESEKMSLSHVITPCD